MKEKKRRMVLELWTDVLGGKLLGFRILVLWHCRRGPQFNAVAFSKGSPYSAVIIDCHHDLVLENTSIFRDSAACDFSAVHCAPTALIVHEGPRLSVAKTSFVWVLV